MPEAHPIKKRRILYLDHTAALGGGEIGLCRLLSQLNPQHVEPVVVLGEEGDLCQRLHDIGITPHVIALKVSIAHRRKESLGPISLLQVQDIAALLAYSRRIARFVRAQRIDLIHTNSLKADIIGGLAARLAGVPCLWHVRDRIAPDYLPAAVVCLFRCLCRALPTVVVANSQSTLSTLTPKRLKRGRELCRYRVIYDGVLAPERVTPPTMACPVVALIGRISPWKGQDIFIEAARHTIRRHPNARFQIVGSALFGECEYEQRLRAKVASAGLSEEIEFVGWVNDIGSHLKMVDIVVHASTLGEPFGQVVIEGMAAGRPVVATRGGAIPELVIEGETGLMVPMGDSSAMSEALLTLLRDPDRARRMGASGRRRAMGEFTLARTARSFEELYDVYLR